MHRSGQKVQRSGPASAQVGNGCSNNIQLQQPPRPLTRTNTARCSNHCNLHKGTQIPYKPIQLPDTRSVWTTTVTWTIRIQLPDTGSAAQARLPHRGKKDLQPNDFGIFLSLYLLHIIHVPFPYTSSAY